MNADEQEARSRVYSNDVAIILPLRSGNIAVYNNARRLCGIVAAAAEWREVWFPPERVVRTVTLDELGLV